ncbi:ABC transporter permease subunit [Vibrio mediterranei]|jgi:sn-glycerol 3-phosphate transport system permease protein|uniref:ABC transporter permease subunit n=1 Tax=Vibrio mediterranei TaxID=689 RepID=UPI001EFCAECC|nr:ABC transporter permease subunit [Vibrio mediterranei]MCG9628832.1 ABC transporter permease subunit [Vibrio mediterranei]
MMIERSRNFTILSHIVLAVGALIVLTPIAILLIGATQSAEQISTPPFSLVPGSSFFDNISEVWNGKGFSHAIMNSFIISLIVVAGKCVLASITAFVVVFFRFRFAKVIFWMIFVTLMLPLEVRIVPTYSVAANMFEPIQFFLNMIGFSWLVEAVFGYTMHFEVNVINTYAGIAIPLIATASGTFLFRQYFKQIPGELVEAAKVDGAGALRFFIDILLPISKPMFAALITIMFISSFNTYMWPLMVATDKDMMTAVTSLTNLIPSEHNLNATWNYALAGATITLLPPLAVIILLQKWFIKGLVSKEK